MISNKMKNDLDMLNYGCSINDLIDRDRLQDMTVLSEYTPNELIKNEFKYVYETIKDLNEKYRRKWQLGVISSGAHTEDYIKSYGLEIDDFSGWHNSSVMVVYECPGSNIDACMAMANNTEEDFWNNLDKILPEDDVDSLFDMLLCKTLWHADCGKKEYYNKKENTTIDSGAFKEFNAKTYSQFLLQLILEFKLSNLYTTNIFRYEIFEKNEKNKKKYDSAINLNGILWPEKYNTEYYDRLSLANENMTVFKRELEIVNPKVILATSNPYYCLCKYYENRKNNAPNITVPLIVRIPHPASYLSSRDRYLENTFRIIKAFEESGVIDEDFANEKLLEAYDRIIINNSVFYKLI